MAAKYFLALLVACVAVQVIYGHPGFGDFINNIKDKLEDAAKKVKEDFGNMEDKAKDIWNNMTGKLKNIWDEIKKELEKAMGQVKQQVSDMELDAKSPGAKDCIAQAKDQLSQAEAEIEPKVQACVEQVKKDMQPMMDDIKKEMDNIAPKMSDEVQTCMQMGDWMKCIQGATELAPELKNTIQGLMGDAGKMAQMMPTEAQKAKECVAPIFSDIKQKGQSIITDTASCIKQAMGA